MPWCSCWLSPAGWPSPARAHGRGSQLVAALGSERILDAEWRRLLAARADGTVSVSGERPLLRRRIGPCVERPDRRRSRNTVGQGLLAGCARRRDLHLRRRALLRQHGRRRSTSRSSRWRRPSPGTGTGSVARDGGIFTFGDAKFYGSTGSLVLSQPIVGITTSPSGNGYRLVAKDGGIFSFGDVKYYGSLPGRGVNVTDVVGWRRRRRVPDTGLRAASVRSRPSATRISTFRGRSRRVTGRCDLLESEDARIPAGHALGSHPPVRGRAGGTQPTGKQVQCPPSNPPTMSLAEFNSIQQRHELRRSRKHRRRARDVGLGLDDPRYRLHRVPMGRGGSPGRTPWSSSATTASTRRDNTGSAEHQRLPLPGVEQLVPGQ